MGEGSSRKYHPSPGQGLRGVQQENCLHTKVATKGHNIRHCDVDLNALSGIRSVPLIAEVRYYPDWGSID